METEWGKPGPGESIATVNPNRTPFSPLHQEFVYIPHPDGLNKLLKVDKATGEIQQKSIMVAHPIWLPENLRDVPQPYAASCSAPAPGNRGCWAFNGCPIAKFRPQPKNVIIHKDGYFDSVKCFHAYTGKSKSGFPTSQSAYLTRGWEIVTDRTTIPQNFVKRVVDKETGEISYFEETREVEVPDLADFYPKKNGGVPEAPKEVAAALRNPRGKAAPPLIDGVPAVHPGKPAKRTRKKRVAD